MPVWRKPDLGHTVIIIIETCLWILRITHNECTPKAIAILIRKVTVVPERSLR
jgi:hypothetical protein